MKRRFGPGLLGVLVVLATMTLGGAGSIRFGAVASAAFPAPTSISPTNPLQPLGDCIRDNHKLAVVFLIDESGSLQQTDPANSRVAGMQAALTGLNQLTAGESPTQVDVQMTGFSVGAEERQSWTALNDQTLPTLEGSAAAFGPRNTGFETDYYVALTKAKQLLDQQAIAMNPTGDTPVCRALIWFTDGKLEIDNRTTQAEVQQFGSTLPWAPDIPLTSSQPGINVAATDRARQLLCQGGGVVDQMRSDGIFSAVVPLQEDIAPADLQFLGAVAQGQDGGSTCGTVGAQAQSSGALISASDPGQLIYDFYSAGVQSNPIPPGVTSTGVCSPTGGTCSSGTRTFDLDPSLSRFNVLALTQNANLDVKVTSPHGASVTMARTGPDTATISGAQLSWKWLTPTTLLLTGSLPTSTASQWSGIWSVTFVDPTGTNGSAINNIAVYLFGDLQARVSPGTRLRKGQTGQVPIEVVHASGTPQTDPTILKGIQVTGSISVPGQSPAPLQVQSTGLGTYVATYRPDASLQASTASVHTNLTIVTPDGYALPPVGADSTIPLENPVGFPSIKVGNSGVINLSPIRGPGQSAGGTFTVAAGPGAKGCLWLANSRVSSSPSGSGTVQYRISPGASRDQCLSFQPGARKRATVTATIGGSGTGEVVGTLHLAIRNSSTGVVRTQSIPVRFAMAVPTSLNTGLATWLLLAGILVPLALLYLLNLLTRRFERFDELRYLRTTIHLRRAQEKVEVLDTGILKLSDVAPPLKRPPSFRKFTCEEFEFRAHMPVSPFGAVSGQVSSDGRRVVTSDGLWRDGRVGLVPLGLGAIWVIAVPPSLAEVQRQKAEPEVDLPTLSPLPGARSSAVSSGARLGEQDERLAATLLILFNAKDVPEDQLRRLRQEITKQAPELLTSLAQRLPRPKSIRDEDGTVGPSDLVGSTLPDLPGDGSRHTADAPGSTDSPRSRDPGLPPLPSETKPASQTSPRSPGDQSRHSNHRGAPLPGGEGRKSSDPAGGALPPLPPPLPPR